MASRRAGFATEVGAGARLALSGLGSWIRDPRSMALGAAPAAITGLALGALLVALVANLETVGRGIARRVVSDGWLQDALAVASGLAVLAASAVVVVAAFSSLALMIGQPFFETISRRVDDSHGGLVAPAPEEPWRRGLVRSAGEGVYSVAVSIGVSVLLLLVGLVPVIGSVTAFTVGALVGGRLLAIELAGYPMARRGVFARRDRVRALRPWRIRTATFGALMFLLFLLPFGALIAMPAAMAGATLLARQCTGSIPEAGARHEAGRDAQGSDADMP